MTRQSDSCERGCEFLSSLFAAIAILALSQPVVAQTQRETQNRDKKERAADPNAPQIYGREGAGVGEGLSAEGRPKSPRESVVDLTGYWVSVVTEEWRWRMITPPKGDVDNLPVTAEARKVANAWDYKTSDPHTCLPYGAPMLLRQPMRIKVSWDDDDTLRLETDNGKQTRLFHFNKDEIRNRPRSLQGDSIAEADRSGVKIVTTNLISGWLRKNGVPYSEDMKMVEYVDRFSGFDSDWIVFTTILDDPRYLGQQFVTSTHFKRLPDGSSWNPRPCHTSPPLTEGKVSAETPSGS
jgi:hypothetical protein